MRYIINRFTKSYRLAYFRLTGKWKWGLLTFIHEVPSRDIKQDKTGGKLRKFVEEVFGRVN